MENQEKMYVKSQSNPSFDFWIDNRVDKKVSFTVEYLKSRLTKYLENQPLIWIENTPSIRVIGMFIASKDGLSAVYDAKDFDDIYTLLKSTVLEFHPKSDKQ